MQTVGGGAVSFQPYSPSPHEVGELLRFTSRFPDALICYIHDPEVDKEEKRFPVIHASILDIAKQEQGFGCFFSINGFHSVDHRTVENLKSINAFYVDIDFPKQRDATGKAILPSDEAIGDFKRDAMTALVHLSTGGMTPTFIVETKNGLHAYWCLRDPIQLASLTLEDGKTRDTARIARLLQAYQDIELAIVERLQGDSAAKDVTRVLRIPFTWHLKDPAHPFLCRLKFANDVDDEIKGTTAALYTFKQVRDFFLSPNQAPGKTYETTLESLSASVPPETDERAGLVWKDAGSDDPLPPWVFNELNRIYPKTERPSVKSLMSPTGIPEGERNWSLYIAVSAMRESNKSETEARQQFAGGYNGLSQYEIGAVIKSVYRRPRVHSFGWNHPLVAKHMTIVERSRITSIVKTLAAGYYEEKRIARAKLAPIVAMEKVKAEQAAESEEARAKKNKQLEKSRQKELYQQYEHVIVERYPFLRVIEDLGFYEWNRTLGVFEARSNDDIRYLILREMEADGLLDFRTDTSVKSKLTCLTSLLEIKLSRTALDSDPDLIPVIGGAVNWRTGEYLPASVLRPFLSCLPVKYRNDETAKRELASSRWLRFIHEVCEGSDTKMRLLRQVAGYCLTKSVEYQKMFILLGSGGNGKSVFVETLQAMLGADNSTSLSLKDLQEGFGLSYLFGKRLNVIEEISNNYFESDIIKKIVTGSEIMANRKFMSRLAFRPFAKFIFAVNQLPKINDTTHGLYRRVRIIPFDARFATNADIGLREKLAGERDLVFLWALEGLRDLTEAGEFVDSGGASDSVVEFQEANSPLVEYIVWSGEVEIMDETEAKRADSFPWALDDFFGCYKDYCRRSGYQAKSLQSVLKEMQTLTHPKLYNVKIAVANKWRTILGLKKKVGSSNSFR